MRCHVHPSDWNDERIVLSPEEAHHLLHVLRGRAGDAVELFDGAGRVARGEVAKAGRKLVEIRIREQRAVPRPAGRVALIQALPRAQKMDLIIQKATELGVDAIIPLQAEHGVARIRDADTGSRRDRWRRIAVNAAKQCGSAWLPELPDAVTPAAFVERYPSWDLLLLASLQEGARPLRDAMRETEAGSRCGVLIGPEGDFTPDEIALFRRAGAVPVTLGPLILRAETAALFAMSVMQYELRAG